MNENIGSPKKQGSAQEIRIPKSGFGVFPNKVITDSMQVMPGMGKEPKKSHELKPANYLSALKPPIVLESWNSPMSSNSNQGRVIKPMNNNLLLPSKKPEKAEQGKANKELKKELANMNFALTELMDLNDGLIAKINALESDQK